MSVKYDTVPFYYNWTLKKKLNVTVSTLLITISLAFVVISYFQTRENLTELANFTLTELKS